MNTTPLSEVDAFLAVADCQSFGKAARELGIAQSTVSRRISQLEMRLAQSLVVRTTRRVALTEAGQLYAAELRDVLARLETAQARLQNRSVDPEGLLRVTMPTAFGRTCVVPSIARLAQRHPRLRFELDLSDRYVDLQDGRFDVALRLSAPEQSGVHAEHLCDFGAVLCAAPAYLASRGVPQAPGDLAAQSCLALRTYAPQSTWNVRWQGHDMQLQMMPRLAVTDASALRALTVDGAGIAVLPTYLANPDLAAGRLVEVLPALRFAPHRIFAVYLRDRVNLAKVKVLLEALRDELPQGLIQRPG